MTIVPYDEKYRDDMIFMILQAKDALGRVPRLNEDLLDIRANYLERGDEFWLALDEDGRVIGSVGYSRVPETKEAVVHRLYVKASLHTGFYERYGWEFFCLAQGDGEDHPTRLYIHR